MHGITGYRNEWDLRFIDAAPMDLSVEMGAGTSNLQLAGLSLTRLDVNQGASEFIIDLSGDWARDLDVTIEAGVRIGFASLEELFAYLLDRTTTHSL